MVMNSPAATMAADLRTIGQRRRLDFAGDRTGAAVRRSRRRLGIGLGCRLASMRFDRADRGLHGADVAGRGAATATDELHAGVHEFAREARHVLGRGQ